MSSRVKIIRARKKIVRRFDSHRQQIVVTTGVVRYWFHVLNKALFDSELEQPDVEVGRLRMAVGTCTGHIYRGTLVRVIIKLNHRISTVKELLSTIAHEMVHQWQLVNTNIMNHGRSFTEWKRYIKYKLNISI